MAGGGRLEPYPDEERIKTIRAPVLEFADPDGVRDPLSDLKRSSCYSDLKILITLGPRGRRPLGAPPLSHTPLAFYQGRLGAPNSPSDPILLFFRLRSPLGTLLEPMFIDFQTEAHFGTDFGSIWCPLPTLPGGQKP